MEENKFLNLQLFAGEGAGDGAGEGSGTGENSAVDAGQQRLLELGVPADKLRKRANKNAVKLPEGAVRTAPKEPTQKKEQDAAADTHTEEKQTEAPARMSWDDIMKDPEYNKRMQETVQSRLKTAKGAEESLAMLTPALEVLARKHGLDTENIDYKALAKAVSDDDSYYEAKALEMGVPVDTAKKVDQHERDTARQKREEARTIREKRFQDHIAKLEEQGKAMKAVFPNFDLRTELQNPTFARMTSPNGGISVEDAYYAVHRKELQTAAMQAAANATRIRTGTSAKAARRQVGVVGMIF